MKQLTDALKDFITVAQKSRKYNPNSAAGLRTALRLFEKELNEEEKNSLQLFQENLEQIYQQVLNKNLSSYTAESLDVYKKRIARLLRDYGEYGIDPTKMAAWNPKVRRMKREKKAVVQDDWNKELVKEEQKQQGGVVVPKTPMTKFELQLREGVVAMIYTPHDLSIEEAKKIRGYIDYLMVTIDPNYKVS